MRTYEMVAVFDPALEVEQIEQDLRKLNDLMTAGGTPRRWERWGKRRLAYEIDGRQYGYYVLAVFDSQGEAVAEVDRSLRLNSSVIRHLITQVDPKRVPELDSESVRTLGASPEAAAVVPEPVEAVVAAVADAAAKSDAIGEDAEEIPEISGETEITKQEP